MNTQVLVPGGLRMAPSSTLLGAWSQSRLLSTKPNDIHGWGLSGEVYAKLAERALTVRIRERLAFFE